MEIIDEINRRHADFVASLGIEIGKVTEEQLAGLSKWNMVRLYEVFYQQVFDLYVKFMFERAVFSEVPEEFDWPICIIGALSNEAIYDSGMSHISKKKPLDIIIRLNQGRDLWTFNYIVYTPVDFDGSKKKVFASANKMKADNVDILMFRERWILGLFIHWLTGLHIDREGITFTGSRDLAGNVIGVGFNGGHTIIVGIYNSSYIYNGLYFRKAFSLIP